MKVEGSKHIADSQADLMLSIQIVSIRVPPNFSLLGSPRAFDGSGVGVRVRQHLDRKFVYPYIE